MIIDIVSGYSQGRGGLENVVTIMSNELERRGHEVRMFQFYSPTYKEWLDTLPSMYYYGSSNNDELTIENLYRNYRDKILEIGAPDIILTTLPQLVYVAVYGTLHLGKNRPPVISWVHGDIINESQRMIMENYNGYFAISKIIKDKIVNCLDTDCDVHYIGNPLNISSYKLIKQSKDKMKYLYIGRLYNKEKRIDVLLKALSMIKDEFDFELDLMGNGEDEEKLKQLAVELGIDDKINWLGWVEDPWRKIESSTVLILSSDTEGCPLVPIEALGHGIPVIVSDCDGGKSIVNEDENGWIFERGNSQQLYSILKDIYTGAKVLPTSEKCIESVDFFKTENVIDRMEKLLNQYILLSKYEKSIQEEISKSNFENAKKIINNYNNLFEIHPIICNLQSEILILEGLFDEAYDIVKLGLSKNTVLPKLLLKMAYLENIRGNNLNSIKYSLDLLKLPTSQEDRNIAEENLRNLLKNIVKNITLESIKIYDHIVGNIDYSSDEYDRFIYIKSLLYENNNEYDKAIRGYKTIILNTENKELKEYLLKKVYNIHSNIKYNMKKYSDKFIDIKINDKNEDLISVCMLSYNNSDYIIPAIDSILEQTYPNIEIVIGDDKSENFDINRYKDYILKNNKGNISRLIIYQNDINLGTVCNTNKSFSISHGKYIKNFSADDILYNKYVIEDMYNYIINENYKMIVGNVQYCDIDLKPWESASEQVEVYRRYLPYGKEPNIFMNILLQLNVIPNPGIMFKKELFKEYGLLNERYFILEDYSNWLNLAFNNCKIGYLDKLIVKYRIGPGITLGIKKNRYYEIDLKKCEVEKEEYKLRLKKLQEIYTKVSSNEVYESKKLIDEYYKLFKKDPIICDVDGQILLSKNNIEEADKIISEGLVENSNSINLILKKAYIEFIKKDYIESISYYYKALKINQDENLKIEIINNIKQLNNLILK